MNNFIRHLKKIIVHKWYVFKAMCDCGRPIQGLFHDISKLSPQEFITSVKYYQGFRSPIEAEKEEKGYSDVWFHHRSHNKHHSQYWVDMTWGVINPCKMPYKYIVESVCDTIGAGKSYMGKDWSIKEPFKWWLKRDCYSIFHPHTRIILFRIYRDIYFEGWSKVSKRLRNNYYKDIYENI